MNGNEMTEQRTFVERAPREALQCTAEIAGPTITSFMTRVWNISMSGMLIDHNDQVSVGDVITARLPGNGLVFGQVVRVKQANAGVKFLAPINVQAYKAALSAPS